MNLRRFEDLLRDSIGLDGDSIGTGSIERAVRERAAACGADVDAYWTRLVDDLDERQEFIEAVVVPETWFFRDNGAFQALTKLIQERSERLQADRPLRVLSIPCSSGEEPYSIAMTVLDAGLSSSQFVVDGVDVSLHALAAANGGIYRKNSFRAADLSFRARYFEQHEGGYKLAARVRHCVSFRQGNLLDSSVAQESAYDVVFCRNLLIYFNSASRDRAMIQLLRVLAPAGMLFVGPSESGLMLSHHWVPAQWSAAFAFYKPPRAAAQGPARAAPAATHHRPKTDESKRRARLPFARPLESAVRASGAAPSLDEIESLADRGNIDEAKRQCAALLEQDALNPRASYLMGLIEDASGNVSAATEHYRRVLYLQPKHHEALVHLAVILDREGNKAAAGRLYARARRATEDGDGA
ncbi:MAG TPA: CheR family methyltransferase [Gammaproteobacteria bacterium]|nr:CheR family methyltransferase [Gammaproteobacteria bacterium]